MDTTVLVANASKPVVANASKPAVVSDHDAMLAEIARLRQQNAALAAKVSAKKNRPITFKVGEKGGVSVYGLNVRFPITLYKQQWERLFGAIDDLRAFIKANEGKLATRDEDV